MGQRRGLFPDRYMLYGAGKLDGRTHCYLNYSLCFYYTSGLIL